GLWADLPLPFRGRRIFDRRLRMLPFKTCRCLRLEETQALGDGCLREHVAAGIAGPQCGVGVELFIDRLHLDRDALRSHAALQHQRVAAFAEPQELFLLVGLARAFDDEAPGARAAPRRVRHAAGTEKDLALADRHDLPALLPGL